MRTIDLPLQTRAAAFQPDTIDPEARTIELIWSSGAAVRRYDFISDRAYTEELSMDPASIRLDRLNSGAPLLNSHNRFDLDGVIGVVERAWIADGVGRAIVRFSRRNDVDPVWGDVLTGIIRNVSIGYNVHRYKDVTGPSDKTRRLLAVDWEPEEISMVAVGADQAAGVRSAQVTLCELDEQGGQPDSAPPTGGERSNDRARFRLNLAEREI